MLAMGAAIQNLLVGRSVVPMAQRRVHENPLGRTQGGGKTRKTVYVGGVRNSWFSVNRLSNARLRSGKKEVRREAGLSRKKEVRR